MCLKTPKALLRELSHYYIIVSLMFCVVFLSHLLPSTYYFSLRFSTHVFERAGKKEKIKERRVEVVGDQKGKRMAVITQIFEKKEKEKINLGNVMM